MSYVSIISAPQQRSRSRLGAAIPALALLLLFAAIRPVGYHGGGWDDWHYLEAARCAAEHGVCVPTSHWWARWPLVAPLGASLALLGESRQALWVVPALYAVAATILFASVVERQFGRTAAVFGAIALVVTPVFNERVINPNVDIPELTWVLASLAAMQAAARTGSSRWAAASGVLLALAIASRTTSIVLVPIGLLGLAAFRRRNHRLILPFLVGLTSAMGAEALVYALWTGDPLLAWRLALGHTTIPSSELTGVDLRQSPLFNIAYIDAWTPAAGVQVHWSVDALLNLLAHPSIGFTLILGLILLVLSRQCLRPRERRAAIALAAAAALHFGALVYALAIDPKPRMFLFETAVAATLIGSRFAVLGSRLPRLLAGAAIAFIGATSLVAHYDAAALPRLEPIARQWIVEERNPLHTDEFTRRLLTLVPQANRLAAGPVPASAGALLLVMPDRCAPMTLPGSQPWQLVRSHVAAPPDGGLVAWLRGRRILFGERETPALCLFRRSGAQSGE